MLVLTRRMGQSIIIGDDIVVKILGKAGEQIKIGIDAPNHISVHREEIQLKINTEKELLKNAI